MIFITNWKDLCLDVPMDSLRQDIPSTGVDGWFDLEARSSRSSVEGQIHLRYDLSTREDRGYSEEDAWDEIREHQDLMGVFIEHELKSFKVRLRQLLAKQ